MVTYPGAQEFLPDTLDLPSLAAASRGCRGCDLYKAAERTVFGAGSDEARMLLVGEQPGDQEDRAGEPFVGPAGRLLDKALEDAGIDRGTVYVTNAVKHFRFERAANGKRRIHKKPSGGQIAACRPWLLAELDTVRPDVVVCLGATAAQALLGKDFKLTEHRGEVLRLDEELRSSHDPAVLATIHPSAILRARSNRDDALRSLVGDLQRAASLR
ncbi:UdgX family uracil-DNA binding protein [Rhodococcus chondri]|uniref:Type-4 uracil-DNA glycosylase n=1 Tax=Rhodococcus chondri TaxID=3065941 RepID=A0ABU7JKZ6_9NOCA|nr:UdgX family uracil-DNA binding protein [Rhodococcus sp. CC-R104]MEE2030708.1 UdgX family uracil-DNA binding protein [Rhodococcus sp. CC-R104]